VKTRFQSLPFKFNLCRYTELKETNDILETKSRKLEQLVRLKDAKIQTLLNKLQAMGAQ
jgi:hypothetical protein